MVGSCDGRLGRGGWRRAVAERGRVPGRRLIHGLAPRCYLVRTGPLRPGVARRPYGVGGQRGHAVGDRGVHGGRAGRVPRGACRAAVSRRGAVSRCVAAGGIFFPGRRRAVRRNTAVCRTVGGGIVGWCRPGGSGPGCGRLVRRLPGWWCHDVARPRFLVVDQVVAGSSRGHHGRRASTRAVGPVTAPVQAVLPLIQTLTRLSPDETPIGPPMRRRRHSAVLRPTHGTLLPPKSLPSALKSQAYLADLTQSPGLLHFPVVLVLQIRRAGAVRLTGLVRQIGRVS